MNSEGEEPLAQFKAALSPTTWFVAASAFFGVFGGFGLAGHLSFVLGFGYPLRSSFLSHVQTHGHLQVFGWVAVLLMGVSLHLLPRLLSRPAPSGTAWILFPVTVGLLLHCGSLLVLPYTAAAGWRSPLLVTLAVGALFESFAYLLYAVIVARLITARFNELCRNRALSRLLPYLAALITGFVLTGILNSYGALEAIRDGRTIILPPLKHLTVDTFMLLALVPAALLFSVKLIPLFLGLREPRWPVGAIGWAYTAGALGWLMGRVCEHFDFAALPTVSAFSAIFMGGALVAFVWCLDVVTRRHVPERLLPLINSGTLRGRGLLSDRGEYGLFELHVYAAFFWLLLSAVALIASGFSPGLHADVARHLLLLGFIANLIFGVGYRLIPGLLSFTLPYRRGVAATAIILNIAVMFRVLPRIVPSLFTLETEILGYLRMLFGLSGLFGLSAVMLFSVNLLSGLLRSKLRACSNARVNATKELSC